MTFGLSLDEAARLHGHKGPWLVLGYRAGLRAREVLKPSSEHDLFCRAHTPIEIPYTCALDGIQAAAGCTLGKLSIEIVKSSVERIRYVFVNRRTGRKLELRLKPGIVDLIERVSSDEGVKGGASLIEEELCSLFEEGPYD